MRGLPIVIPLYICLENVKNTKKIRKMQTFLVKSPPPSKHFGQIASIIATYSKGLNFGNI